MAVDSIIARPTNKVRVMVAEASGCSARELSAVATAFPSESAGPIVPKPVVTPAVTIDATAIIVMLSINTPLFGSCFHVHLGLKFGLANSRCRRDINCRQNAKDV